MGFWDPATLWILWRVDDLIFDDVRREGYDF